MGKVKTVIKRALLRHRVNRKISRALYRQRRAGIFALVVAGALIGAAPALANPAPQGQELSIYAGGGAQARGFAYGSEHTDARAYYYGTYHAWVGCYRSNYSVHLWICNGLYVPPGNGGYAEVAYWNVNGWSYGFSPWAYSSCCESHSAVFGTLG